MADELGPAGQGAVPLTLLRSCLREVARQLHSGDLSAVGLLPEPELALEVWREYLALLAGRGVPRASPFVQRQLAAFAPFWCAAGDGRKEA